MVAVPSEQHESLTIEERENHFILVHTDRNGKSEQLKLSETGLIFLSRMLPQTLQKITAARASLKMVEQGISPLVAVPVDRVSVNLDVHKMEVLVALVDRFGNEAGFVFGPDLARRVAEEIALRVSEIERIKTTKSQ